MTAGGLACCAGFEWRWLACEAARTGLPLASVGNVTDPSTGVFWSYAHEDDRRGRGRVTLLARDLADEFSLITGGELELFVDQDIKWGEEWRARIGGALAGASFFIPILTPRYFTREECRKELAAFHGQAQSLGLVELLLPILYVPVPDFDSTNPDELIGLVSGYQYTNWTRLRLESRESEAYVKGVNELAERLAAASAAVADKQLHREILRVDGQDSDEPGLAEVLEQVDARLPDWTDAIESNRVLDGQYDVVVERYLPKLAQLERGGPGQSGPKFALLQRVAREVLPLAERLLAEARVYSRLGRELDPWVLQGLRIAREHPEAVDSMDSLLEALTLAEGGIERRRAAIARGDSSSIWFRERAHFSRLVRQVAETLEQAVTVIDEGNDIVQRWLRERDELLGSRTAAPNSGGAA